MKNIDKNSAIRVLGKGKTALALKDRFPNAILYDEDDYNLYDKSSQEYTIVSPGIPPYNKMVKESNNVISDYDLFYEDIPLSIWISGTNGKTTTTQMCQELLKEFGSVYGGNIGVPLSNLNKEKNIWILETSSFTLHYTKIAKPNIYILLPISEDHISWHGSFLEYKKAKLKPLQNMNETDIAILPKEFEDIKTDAFTIYYETSKDLSEYFKIDITQIKFQEPFLLDAVLALCTRKILFDNIAYGIINSYKVDKHKVEEFKDKNNRVWVDDSKATNVDATINALKAYQDLEIHLILGGDDKGANLEPLFDELKNYSIKVYAIGSNTKRVEQYCKDFKIDVFKCDILENATKQMNQEIIKSNNLGIKTIGILSPAAASLDQFESYAKRGEEFKKFIENLSKN